MDNELSRTLKGRLARIIFEADTPLGKHLWCGSYYLYQAECSGDDAPYCRCCGAALGPVS